MANRNRNWWLSAVLAWCTLAIVSGCKFTDPKVGARLRGPQSMAFDGDQVTIPLVMRDDSPFVEVMINGSGPYLFCLDTGCPHTTISQSLVDKLSLPESLFVRVSSPGHEQPRPPVCIREMRLGQAVLRDLRPEVWNYPDELAVKDGILGLDAFVHCQLNLDLPNGRAMLLRERLSGEPDGQRLFAIEEPLCPIVDARFYDDSNSLTCSLRVDTGYAGSFALSDSVREVPFEVVAEEEGTTRSLYGSYRHRTIQVKARAAIGRLEMTPVPLSMVDRSTDAIGYGEDGLLGMNVLKHLVLRIDFRTDLLAIDLPPAPGAAPADANTPSD